MHLQHASLVPKFAPSVAGVVNFLHLRDVVPLGALSSFVVRGLAIALLVVVVSADCVGESRATRSFNGWFGGGKKVDTTSPAVPKDPIPTNPKRGQLDPPKAGKLPATPQPTIQPTAPTTPVFKAKLDKALKGVSVDRPQSLQGGVLSLKKLLRTPLTAKQRLAVLQAIKRLEVPAAPSMSVVSVPQSTGTRFRPHMAGPLPAEVASTFRGGSYNQVALESDTVLYRVYGGSSSQHARYWSRTAPQGSLQARMDLALPPGNTAQNVVQIRVPQGTTVFEGAAAPNFGQLGGGNQVYIERVDPSWEVKP